MVLDHETEWFSRIKQHVAVIVTPLQYTVDAPVSWFRTLSHDVKSRRELVEQNTRLREQLIFLQAHMQKLLAIKQENSQLRALLKASSASSGHFEQASVLAVSPKSYLHHLIINKGSHHDVYQGQPVLDAHGVMGQITGVNELTSVVSLLTDSQSRIPVQDARSGVRSIVEGRGRFNQLRLRYVTQTMDIQKGDQLITSGLGGVYPFGYPVGRVTHIEADPTSKFQAVNVKPSAHLNRSRLIMLFWPNTSNHKEGINNANLS